MEVSLFTKYVFEFIGTLVLILLGDGVVACCNLKKSKGEGGGWVVITMAWGFAVMCGVFIAGPFSGAHLNPAVTLGFALVGKFAWAAVPGIIGYLFAGGTDSGDCDLRAQAARHRQIRAVLPVHPDSFRGGDHPPCLVCDGYGAGRKLWEESQMGV